MWGQVQNAIQGAGSSLANKISEFFLQDGAEGKMGEGVGWLAGTIIFEVILGILTAGTITAAKGIMKVVVTFAKVLDWTGAALGVAFKAIAKVGGFLLDLVRGLGKLVGQAGGAVKSVMDAIVALGGKLVSFAGELLGKVVNKGGGEVAETVASKGAREATEVGAEKVAKEATEETLEKGAKETAETATERGTKEAAAESGEQASKEAAEEMGEKGAKKADDAATKKARELPLALAEAKGIAEANDLLDTPSPALIAILRTTLMPRYDWIKSFEARPKHKVGHYSIHMIASDHEVDRDYTTEDLEKIVANVQERIRNNSDNFELKYSPEDLTKIFDKAKELKLDYNVIEDLIFVGSRKNKVKRGDLILKHIPADDLIRQMDNYVNEVLVKGYPYLFKNADVFQNFSTDIKSLLERYSISIKDVRIQGSALRTPDARDIDIAVFVSDNAFEELAEKMIKGIRERANPRNVEKLLNELQAQIATGRINSYYFDRIPGNDFTFNQDLRQLINHITDRKDIDLSLVLEGRPFDIRPYLNIK